MSETLTLKKALQLIKTHREVQEVFRGQSDRKTYGVIEKWERPKLVDGFLVGDCEDFALECLYRLRPDWDVANLHLAVCRTRPETNGFDHAVLCADTNRGVYVLDNLQAKVRAIKNLPYRNWAWSPTGEPIDRPWITFTVE